MKPVQKGELLFGVGSGKDLLSCIQVKPDRILVPIALEGASAAALSYASDTALSFGAELVLFHAFDDPECRNASRIERQIWSCLAAVQTRHPAARLFLRAGTVCEQVKAVAGAVGAGLVVMSRDYYHRFLSWSVQDKGGVLTVEGMPCPVALVDAPDRPMEGAAAMETAVVPALADAPPHPATAPVGHPRPVTRRTAWPLSARVGLKASRKGLNRGRLRGPHCFAHAG